MTEREQRAEAARAYYEASMRLAEKTAEIEQELREDIEAGWLSPRQADVILARIVSDDDGNADWPWKRWKEARRVRTGGGTRRPSGRGPTVSPIASTSISAISARDRLDRTPLQPTLDGVRPIARRRRG